MFQGIFNKLAYPRNLKKERFFAQINKKQRLSCAVIEIFSRLATHCAASINERNDSISCFNVTFLGMGEGFSVFLSITLLGFPSIHSPFYSCSIFARITRHDKNSTCHFKSIPRHRYLIPREEVEYSFRAPLSHAWRGYRF